MKKILTFAVAVACAFTATAQSGKCVNETPALQNGLGTVSFISSKTWRVGNQVWSDAVTATKCQKTTYYGISSGEYNADCRKNGDYGDLFSWCAVSRFQKQLCPAPWRVPTTEDFAALDKALENNGKETVAEKSGYGTVARTAQEMSQRDKYLKFWGGVYGGYCLSDGALYYQGSTAYYWSQSEYSSGMAYRLYFASNGEVYPQGDENKGIGISLRCVR